MQEVRLGMSGERWRECGGRVGLENRIRETTPQGRGLGM